MLVSIDPMQGRFNQTNSRQFFDALLPRVAGFPGVNPSAWRAIRHFGTRSPSLRCKLRWTDTRPMQETRTLAPGRTETSSAPDTSQLWVCSFFAAVTSVRDGPQSPKVAIVNEQFGRKYFGNKNPLGYRVGWNGKADIEIVGVVRDVKYEDLRNPAKPYWYIPYSQVESSRWQMMTVHARITGDIAPVVAAIRDEIRTLDQTLPVFQVATLEAEIGFHLSRERLITALGFFFAALAALLAGVGIFGLAAQTVTRRMKEIGIRMAFGAKAAQVVGGIVNEVRSWSSAWESCSEYRCSFSGAACCKRLFTALRRPTRQS